MVAHGVQQAEPTMGVDPAADDPAALRARWASRVDGGKTRREVTLASLKSSDRPGGQRLDLRGIALIGESLGGVDLSHCDLGHADLSQADLSRAKLAFCNLADATLFQTRLDDAELLAATMQRANLTECSAARAGFGRVDLTEAQMFEASVEHATFNGARLVRADLRSSKLQQARLRDTDLTGADLSRADLRGCDLEDAQVPRASFRASDLREARVRGMRGYTGVDWIHADIRHVDFCGAYLVRRHILDQNYLHEFRSQSRTHEALYKIWQATSACGRSFTRWGLWTVLVAVIFAGVYTLTDVDYGAHQTPLSPLYFSVVTLTTLGFGDVLPASLAAQIVVVAEVAVGYLALGGLLSIFANKMGRLAD